VSLNSAGITSAFDLGSLEVRLAVFPDTLGTPGLDSETWD